MPGLLECRESEGDSKPAASELGQADDFRQIIELLAVLCNRTVLFLVLPMLFSHLCCVRLRRTAKTNADVCSHVSWTQVECVLLRNVSQDAINVVFDV